MLIEPDELEDLVVGELGGSALFGARFRENAGRALLIPRAYPGRRTPLWQQRLKSQTLLEVAKRYAQFPIVLETYRECLRDVLDVPGLQELLRKLHSRELSRRRGRDADRVAVRLLAALRLRRDLHVRGRHAERRAPRRRALARPRPAARAARPGGAARPDRPRRAGAGRGRPAAAVRAHPRGHRRRAARRPAPARRPDRATSSRQRAARARTSRPGSEQLGGERRAIRVRVGGEQRWVAAEDAGLYRDALGAVPPGGLPTAFLEDVPDALERLVRRWARTHGPFEDRRAARRATASTSTPCWQALERAGDLVRGELRPGGDRSASGATPRSCGGCAAPRSPCCARRSSPPTSARWRASCRAGRASTATRRPAPGSTGCARCSSRCRGWRCPPTSGSATCCRAAPAPTRRRGWTSCARPARSSGSAPGSLGRRSGRVALYFREDAPLLGPPPGRAATRRQSPSPPTSAIRDRLRQGACFFTDLLVDVPASPPRRCRGAVGPRLGRRGDQRRVGAAALAAAHRSRRAAQQAPRATRRRRFGRGAAARAGGQPFRAAGR